MDGLQPNGTTPRTSEPTYCLRGEIGGARRLYRIQSGANLIGSRLGNSIVLPTHGVSREHAELRLEQGRLSINDHASTNGTFVNGRRIAEAELEIGDVVGLGSVELEIVRHSGEDLTLAFTVELGEPGPAAELGEQATDLLTPDRATPSIDLVEAFVEELSASAARPAAAAAAAVVRAKGLTRGCVVTWDGLGEPVLLAAEGEPVGEELRRLGRTLFETAKRSASRKDSWSVTTLGDGLMTCAVLAETGSLPLALVLPGRALEPPEGRAVWTILRLVSLLRRTAEPDADANGSGGAATSLAFPEEYVVGRSEAMASLYRQMRCLLSGRIPVLLLGETGVGKEHLADILHRSSDRSSGPFIAMNCAAIPEELLETEMFGIASGVATGVTQRPGRFRQAHGGTLFLDEIDAMPTALQAKLLRAIEESEVRPVGGELQALDVRIVAAANGDLPRLIEEGSFRRDLYYRLAGYELRVPPLREHREDVPALVEHFVREFSAESGKSLQGMTVAAMKDLVGRAWPGNVRELRHQVRRLVYFCPEGEAIRKSDLPQPAAGGSGAGWVESLVEENGHLDLRKTLSDIEARIVRLVLLRTDGNKTAAAQFLGVSRNGLRIKLERLGLANGGAGGEEPPPDRS